jgi:hypothetical protein
MNDSSAFAAATLEIPASLAIASTSSALVMLPSLF